MGLLLPRARVSDPAMAHRGQGGSQSPAQQQCAGKCGVDVQEIGPEEVLRRFPLCKVEDVLAGFLVEGDGRVNPVDATMALAKGARMAGARIVEGCSVTGVTTSAPAGGGTPTVTGVTTAAHGVNGRYVHAPLLLALARRCAVSQHLVFLESAQCRASFATRTRVECTAGLPRSKHRAPRSILSSNPCLMQSMTGCGHLVKKRTKRRREEKLTKRDC